MHKITNEANIRYLRIHTDHPSVEVRLVAGRISAGHPEMHDDFTSSSRSSQMRRSSQCMIASILALCRCHCYCCRWTRDASAQHQRHCGIASDYCMSL